MTVVPVAVTLLSYPRSGSTLTRQYLAALQGRPQLSQYPDDIVVPTGAALAPDLTDVRIVKSHHFSPAYQRAIYLVRDGRNAMLSNLMLKFLAGGHRLERPDEIVDGLQLLAAEGELWGDHVAAAMAMAEDHPVCFVRFEDLVRDPTSALARMTGFVGRPVPAPTLATCVEHVRAASTYEAEPLSGYTARFSAGSIFERLQAERGDDYWRSIFDGAARRRFHDLGGTPWLLRFGYERSADWWIDGS